jgi:16S rRNA (uracil1498-N3)-methyltransferase
VVERQHRAAITLFCGVPFAAGEQLDLEGDAAHHAHVRRVSAGDPVRLLDGRGRVASGEIVAARRNAVVIAVAAVVAVPRPPTLEVIAPVADRDRMLVAAEKCVELQITAWRPAYFARSRSVSPRGEGEKFREKVSARMQAALEQSGGAWLPELFAEAEATEALRSAGHIPARMILDAGGTPLASQPLQAEVAFAVGPEGGLDTREVEIARDLGWRSASLGSTTLRFETAMIAGAAVIRAMQSSPHRA